MAKFKYEVRHLRDGSGVVETQFRRQTADAPAIPNQYAKEGEESGKYKDGKVYSIDPEKLEAEAEEVIAEQQSEQIQAQAEEMQPKKGGAKKAGK